MSVVGGVDPGGRHAVRPRRRDVDLDALDAHVAWLHAQRNRLRRAARDQRRGPVLVARASADA